MVERSGLRREVWLPALNRAGLAFRAIKQTRHTFATLALSLGGSPLWIANHLGHRNTEMIIRVYGKYIENAVGNNDGEPLNHALQQITGKQE